MPARRPVESAADREYYPRRIALVAPQGESVFEFVITGDDRPGTIHAISGIFSKHYVNLTSLDSDSIASGEFVLVIYADFRKADVTADQVHKEISELKFVNSSVFGKASSVLFERYLFPITAGGNNRAIILPALALVGYEKAVMERAGAKEGAEHLVATGRPVGLGLASTLRAYMPWTGSEKMVDAASDAMRALGWGLCSFDRSVEKGAVHVTVKNPVFAGISETSVSWLLVGVISGILEDMLETPNAIEGPVSTTKDGGLKFKLVTAAPKRRARA